MVRVWSRKLETCQLSATNVDYNFGGKNLCVSDKNSDIFYSANVKASGGGESITGSIIIYPFHKNSIDVLSWVGPIFSQNMGRHVVFFYTHDF